MERVVEIEVTVERIVHKIVPVERIVEKLVEFTVGKVVEGIGPKIAELLNEADIWTFQDLAFTPVTRLREILDAGGSRFQIHNPETWPRQSALASVGNF